MHYLPESLTVRSSVHSRICVCYMCVQCIYSCAQVCAPVHVFEVCGSFQVSGPVLYQVPPDSVKAEFYHWDPDQVSIPQDSELLSVLDTCINMTGFLCAWVLEFEIRSLCFLYTSLDSIFLKNLLLSILENFSDLLISRFLCEPSHISLYQLDLSVSLSYATGTLRALRKLYSVFFDSFLFVSVLCPMELTNSLIQHDILSDDSFISVVLIYFLQYLLNMVKMDFFNLCISRLFLFRKQKSLLFTNLALHYILIKHHNFFHSSTLLNLLGRESHTILQGGEWFISLLYKIKQSSCYMSFQKESAYSHMNTCNS